MLGKTRGQQEAAREPEDCTGTECLEVFSCYGMRETTFHLREPFITVAGAIALPLGVFGAHQGSTWHLQWAILYLAINAMLRFSIIVADSAYFGVCGAYSYNVVDQILLQTKGLVYRGVQERLAQLSNFPVDRIDAITGGFHTLAFYVAFACAWLLFVAYLTREAYKLGQLLETGPLGLGVHYGLDQWDEEFRYNDVAQARRLKASLMESNFVNDATIPEWGPQDLFPGFAVGSWSGRRVSYGSAG